MEVTFLGACKEVTGSSHLISTKFDRILLDCGLFQGKRKESREKNKNFSFLADNITNVLLSHAHIDHSGRLPLLSAQGFKGRVITTRATYDACEYMLKDSAHIQESDADYLNYKTTRLFLYEQLKSREKSKFLNNREIRKIKKILKRNQLYINREKIDELITQYELPRITPLYTSEEAEMCLKQFEGYPYNKSIEVGKDTFCTFYDAGHILGSAVIIVDIKEGGKRFVIGYTGDLGRFQVPILRDLTLQFPPEHQNLDLLIMESTYGNQSHEPIKNLKSSLEEVINRTYARGGSVIIPSFAMERSQTLIYLLHELYNEGKLPSMPVYVDSPLALNLTKVFGEHPECYDYETHKTFLENGENPFSFRQLKYVHSVEESMALVREQSPHIVISASGMCETGRILHHLRYNIHNERNTILFVGFQAQNTLGKRILDLAKVYKEKDGDYPWVRFMNKDYPIKSEVVQLEGFSAHADQSELVRFLTQSNLKIKKIALVHGEEDVINSFAKKLENKDYSVFIPNYGDSYSI
jgi:metallo-beta-lactamase family protein